MEMTDRLTQLTQLGYSEREAAFVCMAALQSGYFLRRQFLTYVGAESGGADERFLDKARAFGHVREYSSADRTVLYHLGTRPLYRFIGDENNRNRRTRSPESIKQRLMSLDFVLDNPGQRYLFTEEDKRRYFGQQGIADTQLPTKTYAGQKRGEITNRYFVDKFPLFVSPPVVHFCYVDAGFDRGARFETYLRQYRDLFGAVGDFELVYLAETEAVFEGACRLFERFEPAGSASAVTANRDELKTYFEARRSFEQGRYDLFDQGRLDKMRDDRQRFAGAFHEALYRRYLAMGVEALVGLFRERGVHAPRDV